MRSDQRVACNLLASWGEYLMVERTGQSRNQAGALTIAGPAEEAHLARQARAGDSKAFSQLAERHYLPVCRLVAALIGGGPEAEDATQDVFLRAFEGLRRYDPRRPFGPWLRGIAVKVAQQHRRQLARQGKRQTALAQADGERAGADAGATPGLLLAALDQLDDPYRVPLVLFYVEDASVAEVAEALGLSEGAVRVRLHRGREKLRSMVMEPDE